jgi:hypothetical protein
MRGVHSRPYLCALLGNDGEAYLLFTELHPRKRTERVERRGELCERLVVNRHREATQMYW